MLLKKLAAQATLAVSAALLAPLALAQNFVSIDGSSVNVRERPTTRAAVLWELTKGYPLQVTRKQGDWVRVRDFEGDLGWVSRKLVAGAPHHIVRTASANLRARPSTRSAVVGRMERYEVLRTLSKQQGWVQVQRADGRKGWVARNLVWGW